MIGSYGVLAQRTIVLLAACAVPISALIVLVIGLSWA